MGWNNPPIPWRELEQALSRGVPPSGRVRPKYDRKFDGGDAPAFSRKRAKFEAPEIDRALSAVPYAELHAHSHYSFLDGASSPEALVVEAARLGLSAIAITDHDGVYGAVRFAEAAEAFPGLKTVYGAELSLGLDGPQNGVPDPAGEHLLVLARGQEGYHRLAGALTDAHLAPGAEKGRPVYDLDALAATADGHCLVLTGCRKGAVRTALVRDGEAAALREVERLKELFGPDNVVVELFDHGQPLDTVHNDALALVAERARLPVVATNAVHYATPDEYPLATAMAAVRARRSLDEIDGWLPGADAQFLRSGAEMAERFHRYPGAVELTADLAADLEFPLRAMRPQLPLSHLVPAGETPMSQLRQLVEEGRREHYPDADEKVEERLRKELKVIGELDFPGYFLIVHEIVSWAKKQGILCQGRGSAASSAVCYALGITSVDSVYYDLPFERFLSELRNEAPDIDVDFDSRRREEVIQHVYGTYGRRNAAQVANVITYRPKNAVRDMAKALGFSPGQQDAWAKHVDSYASTLDPDSEIPAPVAALTHQLLSTPRHLGIHSGGMVLTERPVGEVCPIEHARMDKRTVLQWDKDDCASMGLVKFDLLGLGMLAALQYTFDLVAEHLDEHWDLSTLPKEEQAVYDMLCRADSVGVFQVESRAQIGTLPRLKPRSFYDLAVEIALIRPGPIQGGAVHPYIRRRTGEDKVTYDHHLLEPVLKRTLGVPLFQEQLMQMAIAVGNCSPADADQLRRAMGSKRGVERIDKLREKLHDGMKANGLSDEVAAEIYNKIEAFANFGFAESHAISFALLVYASSWLKLHYPAAFLAALLRAQPMGFYSPQSLVADAKRHGVQVRRPDLQLSAAHATLELIPGKKPGGLDRCRDRQQPPVAKKFDREKTPDEAHLHHRDLHLAVRLGLSDVNSIGEEVAQRIVDERDGNGPFWDLGDLARRAELSAEQLEALSLAGALDSLMISRREGLWRSRDAAAQQPDTLELDTLSYQPPLLPMLTDAEKMIYDMWATGISTDDHPIRHLRAELDELGVLPVEELPHQPDGERVLVAGVVTHRQRPGTAGGVCFVNLEDETGQLNVIVSLGAWNRYRKVARSAPAMLVRGKLQVTKDGVINLMAEKIDRLAVGAQLRSRDFR
ncbi:error-prone DNA polymerase [Nocardioides speluncae]|uniref:error-prone DNA polymerase n=1 Tax=Nocardioides speluncae TaxID=2670337 RepID=UPI000D688424|nr:error-prone DNA polymerase [Nocardioides speluncae]